MSHHSFYTLKWKEDSLSLINQKVLPLEEEYITCSTYKEVADAIETMVVRGAPAIGVTAAYGIALGYIKSKNENLNMADTDFKEVCDVMSKTRPTAV